jgi:hypothetical protein
MYRRVLLSISVVRAAIPTQLFSFLAFLLLDAGRVFDVKNEE